MNPLTDIPVIILVGGLGARLQHILPDRPKPMAEINGRPFLSYLLDHFIRCGLRRVILATGFKSEIIRQYYGESYGPLSLKYSTEEAPLGTGGALSLAYAHVSGPLVLAANGDSYCHDDLQGLFQFHNQRRARVTMLLTAVPEVERYGQVLTDKRGAVSGFKEKKAGRGSGLINAGIYLLETELLNRIPSGRQVSLEAEIIPSWIGRGFYGYISPGPFIDIGTPESLSMAAHFLAEVNGSC